MNHWLATRLFLAGVTLLAFSWTSCSRVEKPAEILAVEQQLPEKVDYNLHVKPILSDRCFACHGPDKAKQQAGLRLDTPEGAYEALAESGKRAIVPENLAKSELYHRIVSNDPDYRMPTPESNLTLTAEEKAILVRWIEQGAEYKPHWSLVKPEKPALPEVKEKQWVRNDIDQFVLKKLEEKGLKHAAEADKAMLLRRVTLDLTGLPPSPAEVDAFLADQSPNAYEKVVNRLLYSPQYGERQAAEWLDVARYADTHGYQDDGMRTMWPYRDWVIKAYNQNLPYDQFITWQLAGDMLPKPAQPEKARDILIATAFNRNHQQSQEGGIVDEEYRVEYVADRTNTFGKAMLGLTVECARCHDHKYDPISQKDYFSLFAFFNSNNDRGQIPYNGEAAPTITLTSREAEEKLRFIHQKLKPLQADLLPNRPDYQRRFSQWIGQAEQSLPSAITTGLIAHYSFDEADPLDYAAWTKAEEEKSKREEARRKQEETKRKKPAPKPEKSVAKRKMKAELDKDPRNLFVNSVNDTLPARLGGDPEKYAQSVPGRFGKARFLPGDSQIQLPFDFAVFEQNQPFTISSWFNLAQLGTEATLLGRTTGPMDGQRGYQLDLLKDGRLKVTLSHVWPDNALDIETIDKVPVKKWFQVAFTYDGSGQAKGLSLYLNGQPARTKIITDNLKHSIIYGKDWTHWAQHPFYIGRMHDYFYKNIAVDELRIYDRCLTSLEMPQLAGQPDALSAALRTPAPKRTPAQRAGLYNFYVTVVDTTYRAAHKKTMQLRGDELMLYTNADQVMVMRERRTPRKTFLLKRGAYDAPGEEVKPATLSAFGTMPAEFPRNRLGLAKWVLSKNNPLFARVIVNRVWQQYFGQGLVKSSDDFGNQGALPSHPELLDYLAIQFREGGGGTSPWNMKALHKQIVMSATYRQSSAVSDAVREKDFDNTYLSRGPSYRLSAEQVRDVALAASGLLTRKVGGGSVYPYQPAGIWEALATRNATKYVQSHNDSLYRRSMYTFWKRSSPPPMMLNFDASERHFCIVRRQKTSTPLQALVTLNDPQLVEAARVLAQQLSQEKEAKENINFLFKSVISRAGRSQEIALMQQLYEEELADFKRDKKRAKDLVAVGEYPLKTRLPAPELAAWTVVASTIMNFDEAIIKR
ncbi:DUF1553 domain-containing protein [Tellurirhabdus bombi]|uniref:DUF1553 domain-containing protein n=1 Tax=Tellurirhabdus bombi TaxID=2907205 RepID=UPI001F23AB8B|nr:DUF1553 domain-containing protein [Tellurirhabdus bombi]